MLSVTGALTELHQAAEHLHNATVALFDAYYYEGAALIEVRAKWERLAEARDRVEERVRTVGEAFPHELLAAFRSGILVGTALLPDPDAKRLQ